MSDPVVPEIEPQEALQRIAGGAFLLDVREGHEWAAGHAEPAAWIPMGEVPARISELPTDREIIVICRSGGRSRKVAEVLRGANLQALNLTGGSLAWQSDGLPFITTDGLPGTVA